jgi:hypothetical protein
VSAGKLQPDAFPVHCRNLAAGRVHSNTGISVTTESHSERMVDGRRFCMTDQRPNEAPFEEPAGQPPPAANPFGEPCPRERPEWEPTAQPQPCPSECPPNCH